MTITIDRDGVARTLYTESIDLSALGRLVAIERASHVEPDGQGRWWADLAPIDGPRLGPYALRSGALAAEEAWLVANRL